MTQKNVNYLLRNQREGNTEPRIALLCSRGLKLKSPNEAAPAPQGRLGPEAPEGV